VDIMTSATVSYRARALAHFGTIAIAAIFLLVGPSGASKAATTGDVQRTITVSGQGQITATPDQARLSAGVVTQDQTAAAALDTNTKAMNSVFAAMKRLGIPDNKIRTSTFTLTPQYSPFRPDNPEARTIVGYLVSNQVTIIVNDIGKVGATLDALIRSGANQAYGVVFEIADEKPLLERVRRAAVAEATTKARTLADAAGVALGPVLSIQETGGGFEPPGPRAFALTAAGPPPVSAGEQTVTVNVTAIYAIQ
jgi:uncharacterized protein YggE